MTDQDRSAVRTIFDACGTQDEVKHEREIDLLTGFSGTGPAFPALLAAAMMKVATAYGLDREIARRAATAVLVGAGGLLRHRNEDPEQIVNAFVEYRGITSAGIDAMRHAGFEAIVSRT